MSGSEAKPRSPLSERSKAVSVAASKLRQIERIQGEMLQNRLDKRPDRLDKIMATLDNMRTINMLVCRVAYNGYCVKSVSRAIRAPWNPICKRSKHWDP